MLTGLKTLIYLDAVLLAGLLLFREALGRKYRPIINRNVFLIVGITPAAGLLAGTVWLFHLYLFLLVAFLPKTKAQMCSYYLLLVPLVPALSQEIQIGSLNLFAVSTLLFLNLGGLLGLIICKGPTPPHRPLVDLAVAALILLSTFIEARGLSGTHWLRMMAANTLLLGAPYLIVSRSIASEQHLARALLCFAAVGVAISAVAIFEALRSWPLYQGFYEALGVPLPLTSMTLNVRGGFLRAPGPFMDATSLGLFLAILIVLLDCLRRRFRPWHYFALLGAATLALLVTQSRGGWLAAASAYLAVTLYRGRAGTTGLILAGAMVLGSVYALSTSNEEVPGFNPNLSHAETTAQYRTRLLERGLQEVDKNPWIGRSEEETRRALVDLVQGQGFVDFVNQHLYIALTSGYPGLALWLCYWLLPIGIILYRRRSFLSQGVTPYSAALLGTMMASIVALAFTSATDRNLVWGLLLLGTLPSMMAMRARSKAVQILVPIRLSPTIDPG